MKVLLLDGPNRGQNHNIPEKIGNTFKVIDPRERIQSYVVGEMNPETPIKVNTYYRVPLHAFAEAYGFDALFRFSSSNC